MRKTPKMLTRALASAVALFFVTFIAAPPAFAAASLDVSQLTGLKDGQTVTISGSGFTPGLKSIAVGQCIEGMTGPSECNTAGGATFVDADASGNIASFTLVVKEKFGTYDCTTQQCVFGAQPLPGDNDEATVKANSVYFNMSFGEAEAAPAEPAATPAASGEELPKTGAGETLALALAFGSLLFLGGALTMWKMPRGRGGVA